MVHSLHSKTSKHSEVSKVRKITNSEKNRSRIFDLLFFSCHMINSQSVITDVSRQMNKARTLTTSFYHVCVTNELIITQQTSNAVWWCSRQHCSRINSFKKQPSASQTVFIVICDLDLELFGIGMQNTRTSWAVCMNKMNSLVIHYVQLSQNCSSFTL